MESFLPILAQELNIDKTAITDLWSRFSAYNKMKKPELHAICCDNNYENTGVKYNLIESIILKKPQSVAQPTLKQSTLKKKPMEKKITTYIENVRKPVVEVSLNKFGNYEHDESGLVFDKVTKQVVGKQDYETGEVTQLTEDDFMTCKMYGVEVRVPDNLNQHRVYGGPSVKETLDDIEEMVNLDDDDDSDEEIVMEL